MNLGNKIRQLRKAKNLTQEQMAVYLNISPQAVSKWEMGLSFPDTTMLPTIARLFKISLDELFDYDVNDMEKEIETIRLEYNNYFWSNFEKAEEILLSGLEKYPASIQLKTELFELYTYNLNKGEHIINKAFELSSEIIHLSQDVFCTCRTKANLILVYQYLEGEKGEKHQQEIQETIRSLPYMYPYMLQDKMRLSAEYLQGEEAITEAQKWKDVEWQELFNACFTLGNRYFEMGDYQKAMTAYRESVDVIERFMIPQKQGCDAYPISGTHANHAITVLSIAACEFRLGNTQNLSELIAKAKHIYFDAYNHTQLYDYEKTMGEMLTYFSQEYIRLRLDEYQTLDLSAIENRIKEST